MVCDVILLPVTLVLPIPFTRTVDSLPEDTDATWPEETKVYGLP